MADMQLFQASWPSLALCLLSSSTTRPILTLPKASLTS